MKLTKSERGMIDSEFAEDGAYWIELAYGFRNASDPGTHAFVENTKAECYAAFRAGVEPCDCAECVARVAEIEFHERLRAQGIES
jgi:hypothetical protein